MEKELNIVAGENNKYGDFLNKMRRIIDETIQQIEDEDPGQLRKLESSPDNCKKLRDFSKSNSPQRTMPNTGEPASKTSS